MPPSSRASLLYVESRSQTSSKTQATAPNRVSALEGIGEAAEKTRGEDKEWGKVLAEFRERPGPRGGEEPDKGGEVEPEKAAVLEKIRAPRGIETEM